MPKLKDDIAHDNRVRALKSILIKHHSGDVFSKFIADKLGVSLPTSRKLLNNPELLTLGNCMDLGLSNEEVANVMRGVL